MPGKERVLIVGVSTRGLAESATRAGYTVLSVDGYGDMDNPAVPALSLARDLGSEYSAHAAAAAGIELEYDAVCYCSNLENHPREVELLARRGELWGNPLAVLRRARDPLLISRLLRGRLRAGVTVRASAPLPDTSGPARAGVRARRAPREWLAKPRDSGGGHGITQWQPGDPLPRGHVLQERIVGTPGSLAFVASGDEVLPFAVSRQLVGDAAFGASGFQYCGSILAGHPTALVDAATECARMLTEELSLVGLNCLDFVARDGVPHVIELNPRYSSSMELAERAFGFSVFEAHARACSLQLSSSTNREHRALPRLELTSSLRSVGAFGKAIIFAPRTLTMGDTRRWLDDPNVRDVPHPGETIPRGHPVCTIFATGRDEAACYAALVRKAVELQD